MKTISQSTVVAFALLGCVPLTNAGQTTRVEVTGIKFFESQVRPLLVERCYECHSAKSEPVEGGLRLDSRAAWQHGGDSGKVIVPGKPDESRLLKAVLYQDPTLAMPPDNALPKREIEVLQKWIRMGAPDSRTKEIDSGVREINMEAGRKFWSFQPIREPQPSVVKDNAWLKTPVDRFVLARLEEQGLLPVSRVSRRTLIRRATLDVLGLPPAPEEIESFVNDKSSSAWPRLVDRLLASRHYGERWGRHWLDVARYADDQLRDEFFYRELPHAWRYRDWVVWALNEDMPFDQFVLQQLAGDILVDTFGPQATVATGFLALGMIYQDDGATPEGIAIAKAETLDDRVDTVTRGLLGLTVSCARCHDHKFDPIPTEDYYSRAGVFHNAKYVEDAPLVGAEIVEQYRMARNKFDRIKKSLSAVGKTGDGDKVTDLQRESEKTEQTAPAIYPRAHAVVEDGDSDLRVALRGNLLKPGEIAPRHFLTVIAGDDPPRFSQGSGRLELAQAIVSPDNPLTARVIVNRIWQQYFGRGIVASASNFGAMGEPPTHPRLLDWLASRLVAADWSLKTVHREILLSSVYQLGTEHNQHNEDIDSGNQWLWRMDRRRLDIETQRDCLLSVSGELDTRIGGPAESNLLASCRRTIYGAVRRDNQSDSDELLRMFDFPNPRISSSGRTSTITAQQQLFSLNSSFVIQRARALAVRVSKGSRNSTDRPDFPSAVRQVFLLVLGREPTREEFMLVEEFINDNPREESDKLSRWEQYCQVIMISNEAAYRP